MSAVYAIAPEAKVTALNAVFEALQRGPVFLLGLTTDSPSTPSSPITHRHMYDDNANPWDYAEYSAAKAGTALPRDIYGNPVAWGEDGNPTEAEAYAAFIGLELWANNSSREPADFAQEQRDGLGLTEWSPI